MASIAVERGSIAERVVSALGLRRSSQPRVESIITPVREQVEEVEIVDFKIPVEDYMERTGKPNPFAWRRRIGAVPSFGSTVQLKGIENRFEIKDGKINGIDVHELTRDALNSK